MIIKNNYNKLVIFLMISVLSFATLTFIPTTSAICPDDCPSSLISYWRLDETSAGPVIDCYDSNDGTNYGASIGITGKVGTAYNFNGINNYIEIPDDDSLSFGDGTVDSPFSISAWVYMRNKVHRQRFVAKIDSMNPADGEYLLSTDGNGKFGFFLADRSKGAYPFIGKRWSQPPLKDTWYHLVATYDGSGGYLGIKLYVDGVRRDDINDSRTYIAMENTLKPLCIGKYGSEYLDGMMDEVAIFNVELTTDEISNLYCRGLNGLGICDTLVYTGDSQSSDSVTLEATLSDSSGIGLSGYDVTFNFDGSIYGPVTTDINGVALINIGSHAFGNYDVYAYTNCLESNPISLTIYDLTAAFSWSPDPQDEGSSVVFTDLSTSYPDSIVGWSWDFAGLDVSSLQNPSFIFDDDGVYSVCLTVVDDDGTTNTISNDITILNVAPTIESITGPIEPIQVGIPISITGIFSDPGLLDKHYWEINWGDTNIDNSFTHIEVPENTITQSHTYTEPGIYTITLKVEDDDGEYDIKTYDQYIVIYDPKGGFVTGGGWIYSEPGAYTPDPNLEGKANFGFVSKYKKGQTIPTGNTEFQFKAGNMNFHSSSYQWLVIAGSKAMFKGEGTINGAGNYGFMLYAIDEKLTPSTDVDLFRIKIWDKNDNDAIIYDNQPGDINSDPSTLLGGGQIVIHNK
jgi:PKD repeat protein